MIMFKVGNWNACVFVLPCRIDKWDLWWSVQVSVIGTAYHKFPISVFETVCRMINLESKYGWFIMLLKIQLAILRNFNGCAGN
jgi:hypothetical protein